MSTSRRGYVRRGNRPSSKTKAKATPVSALLARLDAQHESARLGRYAVWGVVETGVDGLAVNGNRAANGTAVAGLVERKIRPAPGNALRIIEFCNQAWRLDSLTDQRHSIDWSRHANETNAAELHQFGHAADRLALGQENAAWAVDWLRGQKPGGSLLHDFERDAHDRGLTEEQIFGCIEYMEQAAAKVRQSPQSRPAPVSAPAPDAQAASDVAALNAEVARIELRMRTDLKGYSRDEAEQRFYRDAIDALGSERADAQPSAPPREAELDTLTKMMGDRNSAYWKGSQSDSLQARYRELLEHNA